jgi:glycosyltransferase involved in cell wall biosynthesis
MTIVYSFNKTGYEADYWAREIAASSNDEFTFVPFNHGTFLDPQHYIRAQLLDNLYFANHPPLIRMYQAFMEVVHEHAADAMIVDNCPPYHPDVLRTWPLYKVLRAADGPLSAYDRDFAYVHAYDHILYHSPAYSRDLGMADKLAYCGAKRADFWPLAVFDVAFDQTKSEDALFAQPRDIDVIFIGAMHVNKMPMLARVKKAFGRRCVMHGLTTMKRNLYFNAKFGFPGWIREVAFEQYVPLYQRAKIGINVHNRGDYTVGGYRLFELPANGVLEISDGGDFLGAFFDVGSEIVGYRDADDLIDKIRYYLANEAEREQIARAGYRRAMRDHRLGVRMREAGELIRLGIAARAASA